MESGESKKRLIRSSEYIYTNSTTSEYGRGKHTPKKDATSLSHKYDELGDIDKSPPVDLDKGGVTDDGDLQSRGINIVDSKTKNFSNVTPEEVSDYYKSLGEWQNILPKTDYTYSPMSQYYTKKINGKIPIIPNMCRRNIWKINGAEVQDNEFNLYLAKNYEYEEKYARRETRDTSRMSVKRIFRQITTVTTTVVRTVMRRISLVNTAFSSYSTNSTSSTTVAVSAANSLRNFFMFMALALIFYYLILGGHLVDVKFSTPFVNLFHLFKNLVFYLYDLTWSSTTFLTSLISVCLSNATQAANTVILAPFYKIITADAGHRKTEIPSQPVGDDVEAILRRWFDENAENIAKKVIGNNEFLNFIDDRFRQHRQHENDRFDKYLKGYDFESTILGQKLRSLETKMDEWRNQRHSAEDLDELKVNVDQLRDYLKTKDKLIHKEILIVLSTFVGGDASDDDLRNRFDALIRSLNETRVKIDTLTANFENYSKKQSEKSTSDQKLSLELDCDWKSSVEEMITKRLHEWKHSMTSQGSVPLAKMEIAQKYVEDAIKRALEIYDADKTGKPDFALESQGGTILSTRCTETKTTNAQFSIFGIPLWHVARSPRTVIQPGVHPGECWAFPGSTGYLVIQLSEPILITGFTMEHIPRSLASNGNIDSAPKDFNVWALKWESDPQPKLLGQFTYDDRASSVQYFEAIRLDEPYQIVELKILSNHGKMDYTCLYRFRVHGIPH